MYLTACIAKPQKSFEIPFEVPYNGISKELMIFSTTSWVSACVLIGSKMVRNPASLQLGYINPFKP
jgi:hypothetical protein